MLSGPAEDALCCYQSHAEKGIWGQSHKRGTLWHSEGMAENVQRVLQFLPVYSLLLKEADCFCIAILKPQNSHA